MSGKHELLPARVYINNFFILAMLMTLTIVAYYMDFGAWAFPVALIIAGTKATFILLIFMNVKYSSKLTMIFAAAGFFWFLILIAFIFSDFLFWEYATPFTDSLPRH